MHFDGLHEMRDARRRRCPRRHRCWAERTARCRRRRPACRPCRRDTSRNHPARCKPRFARRCRARRSGRSCADLRRRRPPASIRPACRAGCTTDTRRCKRRCNRRHRRKIPRCTGCPRCTGRLRRVWRRTQHPRNRRPVRSWRCRNRWHTHRPARATVSRLRRIQDSCRPGSRRRHQRRPDRHCRAPEAAARFASHSPRPGPGPGP